MITPKLFEELPTPEVMSEVSVDFIFELIKSYIIQKKEKSFWFRNVS